MTAWLVVRLWGQRCTCGRRLEVATPDACRATGHGEPRLSVRAGRDRRADLPRQPRPRPVRRHRRIAALPAPQLHHSGAHPRQPPGPDRACPRAPTRLGRSLRDRERRRRPAATAVHHALRLHVRAGRSPAPPVRVERGDAPAGVRAPIAAAGLGRLRRPRGPQLEHLREVAA